MVLFYSDSVHQHISDHQESCSFLLQQQRSVYPELLLVNSRFTIIQVSHLVFWPRVLSEEGKISIHQKHSDLF